MRTATRPASLLTVAVLAGCLAAPGCIPGVAWTPDSRGFYYTGGKDYHTLSYFDVATKKARTVVADTGGLTQWPAVSPDGQRVAVAVPVEVDGHRQYRVVVYDPKGKELQRSRPVAAGPLATVNPNQKDKEQAPVWLFWAPRGQGDKVLLQVPGGCALIDLKEDRFTDLGKRLLWVFGNSPIRPDGKGFLTLRSNAKKEEKEVAAFYDWQGKKRTISPADPEWKWAEDSNVAAAMMLFPYLFPARWQGDVASVRGAGVELTVDTDKLQTRFRKIKPGRTSDGQVIRQEYRFANGGVRIRVSELEDDPKKEQSVRVQVLPPGAAARELVAKAALSALLPSPDGKTLVLRYVAGGVGNFIADRIVVLNAQGEVLAELDGLKQ